MKLNILIVFSISIVIACSQADKENKSIVLADGQMPALAFNNSTTTVVYGHADSILYTTSADEGNSFSKPALVSLLPDLAASHSRGPQITTTNNGLAIIACNNEGDIFSYHTDPSGKWTQGPRINDADTVAKEGLMSLAADGNNVFAVWLDLRTGNNQIYGARSTDGGVSWSKNMLIYASPDTTVCECCKPSVAVKGNNVSVMFRNWLNQKRDLYLIQSTDGGNSFGQAQKLGNGSWALKGCPMDGGGLVIKDDGSVETTWRREKTIYSCIPGQAEKEMGKGKGVTMTNVGGQNVYAWTEDGNVVCVLPNGKKQVPGKGMMPAVKAIGNDKFICVWENNKQVHSAVMSLSSYY